MIPVSRLAVAFILLFVALSYAENYVAVNSLDGRDVLSGIFYANAKGLPVHFMPSSGGNSEVFARKIGTDKSVLLIQSSTTPVSGFVESELKAKNNAVELYLSSDATNTNLDLAKRSGAESFIIVDSAYSDGAISVIPYAVLTKSYVILADKNNINEVKGVTAGKKVIIYGLVDKDVKTGLAGSSPTIIGTGDDKYDDNIALVGKMMDENNNLNRPIITDGGSIEDAIAEGKSPIILTGRLVPQSTYDFIKARVDSGQLTSVLLIGNDLVSPVYDMRERIKGEFKTQGMNKSFGIMIKFAQGTSDMGVMGLDTFKLPAYKPTLKIAEISYNKQTGKAMVGVENTGDGPAFFNLELRIKLNGEDYQVFSEKSPQLIERGESAGLQYDLDISKVTSGELTANALLKYGSTSKSLEEFTAQSGKLESIEYVDESNVSVKFAKYNQAKQLLQVTIKNNGQKTAYAFTKVTLVDEAGVPTKFSGSTTREIEPASVFIEEIPISMTSKEIDLNKDIKVAVDYGGRRSFLVKKAEYTVPLEREAAASQDMSQMLVLGLGVLVVIAIIFVVYKLATGKKK